MPILLRITLIIVSLGTCFYTLRKISKAQMQINDSLFWIFSSISLVIISVFPNIAFFFAKVLEIDSAVNFVYLTVIFLLILKVFTLSIKQSQTEERIKNLVQRIAIENKKNNDKNNDRNLVNTKYIENEAAIAREE